MTSQREIRPLRRQLQARTQELSKLLSVFEQQLQQSTIGELKETYDKMHADLSQQHHLLQQLAKEEEAMSLFSSGLQARAQPYKEHVLSLLDFLHVPAQPPLLHDLLLVRYGETISIPRLQQIGKKEEQRYLRDPDQAAVWITPALNASDGSSYPTYVTCSTWPLAQRIIGNLTLRTIHLSTLLSLVALWTHFQHDISSSRTPVLHRLILHQGMTFFSSADMQDVGCDHCLSPVRQELDRIQDQDRLEREEAASHYQHLSEHHRLWGRPLLIE